MFNKMHQNCVDLCHPSYIATDLCVNDDKTLSKIRQLKSIPSLCVQLLICLVYPFGVSALQRRLALFRSFILLYEDTCIYCDDIDGYL